jgi:hypothetical protein
MTRRVPVLAFVAFVAAAHSALAQTRPDVGGSYTLVGENGRPIGSATISGEGDALVLRARLDDGRERPDMALDPARSQGARLVFAFTPPDGTGLVNVISGTEPGAPAQPMSAEVTRENNGALRATVREGDAIIARERLTRFRAALLVHANTYDPTHVSAFRAYATHVARRYTAMGYQVAETMLGTSLEVVAERLQKGAADAKQFERLVFIGHGGWDGPVLGKYDDGGTHQGSSHYNQEAFAVLVAAIQAGMTPTGAIYSSSCHAAGSNVYERAAGRNAYVWTDDLARLTGRIVAGPAGYTSTEYTERHVMALLEGQGTVVQECKWRSKDSSRTIMGKKSLADAPLRTPADPVHLPAPRPEPEPAPVVDNPAPTVPATPTEGGGATPAATVPPITTITPPAVVNLPLGEPVPAN